MSTWPPPDTPAFQITDAGVRSVLIQSRIGSACFEVVMPFLNRTTGPADGCMWEWTTGTRIAHLADLFATREVAERAWRQRQAETAPVDQS